MAVAAPRFSTAQRSASRRPLCKSTTNQIIRLDARHTANRKEKPCQVLPVLSMIAWITFGPTMDDARLTIPKRPKNCKRPVPSELERMRVFGLQYTHHVAEPWWRQLCHHRLRVRIIWGLEESERGIVGPELPVIVIPSVANTRHVMSWLAMRRWVTHPNLSVQIPIIPQRGRKIATTFVAMS